MAHQAVLSFALLALAVWLLALPLALYCLIGAAPIRSGGPVAAALCAGTAAVPLLVLLAVLVTARVSAGGWFEGLPSVATVSSVPHTAR